MTREKADASLNVQAWAWEGCVASQYEGVHSMKSTRSELPTLDSGAAIYGGGDSVTGVACVIVNIIIFW